MESMTCARYYSLLEKCREALEYASKSGHNFRHDMELNTYVAAEERYNFSCRHLIMRIECCGIVLPDQLKILDGCYLQRESSASIGKTFRLLKAILTNRKRLRSGTKILLDDGCVIDCPSPTSSDGKVIQEFLFKLILFLHRKGITWQCPESGGNWFILIEPVSRKRVRIEIVRSGSGADSISLEYLPETLRLLAEYWNRPLSSADANEGTLVNSGWHSYESNDARQKALAKAILIYGRSHVLKALRLSKTSPWLENYQEELERDISYVSRGRTVMRHSRPFDRSICVRVPQ